MAEATTAIVGLGITEMGKIYGRSSLDFAGEAIALALADAGLTKADVDGLLVNRSTSDEMGQPMVQMELGFEDMRVVNVMNAAGGTAGAMLQYATAVIDAGMANVVALVYADAPLVENAAISQNASYSGRGTPATGFAGLRFAYGDYGPANTGYAQACRRHMHLYGTTSEQLGVIAVGQRAWALENPKAQMKKPMTLEDHQASRLIVDPLHLFDCCLVSNGAVAVIVTSAARARTLKQPPVYLRGFGQGHPGDNQRSGTDPAVHTGATTSGPLALRQAGITLADVDVLSLYDCYTYTVLVTLEDYGYCEKGEGGPFVEDGKLGPGGSLPTNTGGGELSAFYMWGFTPLSEGVIQARGQGGGRQVAKHDHVLVSGNGGVLNWHSTTILSKHAS